MQLFSASAPEGKVPLSPVKWEMAGRIEGGTKQWKSVADITHGGRNGYQWIVDDFGGKKENNIRYYSKLDCF